MTCIQARRARPSASTVSLSRKKPHEQEEPSSAMSKKFTMPSGRSAYSKTRVRRVGSSRVRDHHASCSSAEITWSLMLTARFAAWLRHSRIASTSPSAAGRSMVPPRPPGPLGVQPPPGLNGSLPGMTTVPRDRLRELMGEVLAAQDKTLPDSDDALLADIGFRSLDFSELALRVEDEIDEELNFDAAGLRQITTVAHVLDLLTEIQAA